MANLSNINDKFLFTDGDFIKIGNGALINQASSTESGLSITNSNVASITLTSTGASGKTFLTYSNPVGAYTILDVDDNLPRLTIATGGNVHIPGSVGIGISPSAKLQVYSTAATNIFMTGYGTATQNNWLAQNCMFVKTDNGLLISKENAANNTNRLFNFYNDANGYASLYMYKGDATAQVLLNTSGNSYFLGGSIGIGVTDPVITAWGNATNTRQLTLVASAYAVINLQGSNAGLTQFSMGVGDTKFYMAYDRVASKHRLVVDSNGQIGIGTTVIPTYWSGYTALQLGTDNSIFSNTDTGSGSALFIGQNVYNDGSNYLYTGVSSNEAGLLDMRSGLFRFYNAPNGTAGNNATMTQRFTVALNGNVGIGTGNDPDSLLTLSGDSNSFATAPVIRFDSTSASTNVRNWAIGPADTAYGNFHIMRSATKGGDPLTGAGAATFTIDYTDTDIIVIC